MHQIYNIESDNKEINTSEMFETSNKKIEELLNKVLLSETKNSNLLNKIIELKNEINVSNNEINELNKSMKHYESIKNIFREIGNSLSEERKKELDNIQLSIGNGLFL
jgi:Mg2+ and Co2+ transporter CorA